MLLGVLSSTHIAIPYYLSFLGAKIHIIFLLSRIPRIKYAKNMKNRSAQRLYVYAIIAKFLFVYALAPRRDYSRGAWMLSHRGAILTRFSGKAQC